MNQAAHRVVESLLPTTLVVFGLGREGLSTYQFLRQALPEEKLILIDDRSPLDLSPDWDAAKDDPLASFTSPEEYQHLLSAQHTLFVAPGIQPNHLLLKKATKANARLHSNTQLFFDSVATSPQHSTTIAVTGTKGKSTTSSVIAHVLESAGLPVTLGGNIGVPPLDLLPKKKLTNQQLYFVLELSAHQLLHSTIKPNIAVLLNITPEHLDYYPDFAAYLTAKARITSYQDSTDYLLFNPEYENLVAIADKSAAHLVTFGGQSDAHPIPRAYVSEQSIFLHESSLVELDALQVTGGHMVENMLPAVAIADLLEIPASKIAAGLKSFKPLQHRLEIVHETIGGVTFVDDSLATTPEATIAAINSFTDMPIILLAGGYERNQDFSQLAKTICDSTVTRVLLFPTTGSRLAQEITRVCPATKPLHLEAVDSMEAAVTIATTIAEANTVVLLSPASASFGMFKDYADRSAQFIKAARKFS